MGDVNVTQAARDALADYYAIPGVGDYENSVAERVREGLHEDPLLRAFARFERDTIARLNAQTPEPATQQPPADVVEALRELANCEKTYRYKRDLCGDRHSETRRARNEMRSTGNKARVLLLALRTQAPETRADVVEALAERLRKEERRGLHPYAVGVAKIASEALTALRTQAPASETKDNEPWAWGWYERGGTKRAYPHLPTVNSPADPECEPFPLYRAPPQAPASDEVREAVIEARLALANWSKYESEKDELAYQGNKVANALETILEALGAKP